MRHQYCLALLLLAIPSAIGSVAAGAASTTAPTQSTIQTSDSSPNAAAGPAKTEQKVALTAKRPSVDVGLRYSSNDWLLNFATLPFSYILHRIRFHVMTNVAITLAVMYFYPSHPQLSVPMTGHSLVAASLGLLLSYRTNSAYGRFWEARGHWTSSKVACRNLAVLVKVHIEPQAPKAAKKLLRQLAAFPVTLMFLCLGGAAKLPDYAKEFIPSDPNGYQDRVAYPAILLILELQKTLHEARSESKSCELHLVDGAHMNAASHMIDSLMEHMSCCEKILRTPVPLTYSRHTSRFLTMWMGTLPFALVGTFNKWLVIAIVVAASYCMLGIEEIGHLIEQPFLGDSVDGIERIYTTPDENGETSALIKRGQTTKPYDIGIPVCSLAVQIRLEIESIAASKAGQHP